MTRRWPLGLKPTHISNALRGPEGPLFHGGVEVRSGVDRRTFLQGVTGLSIAALAPQSLWAADPTRLSFRLTDVTNSAGIHFKHHSGAFGGKFLPETLGSGCAFLDYDADGWQDVLLINGTDWPSKDRLRHGTGQTTLQLYRNNRNGTFTDVTHAAGLDAPDLYGIGVAVGDYNNDGFPDILVTCVGQNRLFRNTGKGTFIDATKSSGLGNRLAFSTSAMWFDYDRDGHLDLFVCNYVKWSPEHDVFCSLDGKHKSYCTPEAYRGQTCWLFHNRGDGTFEDVTATSGIFDSSSKSLGVALLDYDQDGWPDLIVANDTQPNKLYRNNRNGTFKEVAVDAGVAFSTDGKARAGMGVDAADFTNSGVQGIAITNFDNEMLGLFRSTGRSSYDDVAIAAGVGSPTKNMLGFGCVFADFDLDGALDLAVANGHIDDTVRNIRGNVGYAQPPQLFLNQGKGFFRDVTQAVGTDFSQPKVGRGLAYGDFDRDGDLDLLLTTNNGPAYLFRNDQTRDSQGGNRSIRLQLVGTQSNRDAIGAQVRLESGGTTQSRMVKSGSSYLSQSELPLTFGLGKRDQVDRIVIQWPNGRSEEFRNLKAGKSYQCVESKGVTLLSTF
ncbi:MAG TPA: CRTAC1 family protein [Terriglobales bacterium]|nr:CRTAC1 family protein [Terriglobales bacterium]